MLPLWQLELDYRHSRPLDPFVQLPAIQSDAAAPRTVIDLDPLAFGQDQSLFNTHRTLHGLTLLYVVSAGSRRHQFTCIRVYQNSRSRGVGRAWASTLTVVM